MVQVYDRTSSKDIYPLGLFIMLKICNPKHIIDRREFFKPESTLLKNYCQNKKLRDVAMTFLKILLGRQYIPNNFYSKNTSRVKYLNR